MCIVNVTGYNDFNLAVLDKIELFRPETDAKRNYKTHVSSAFLFSLTRFVRVWLKNWQKCENFYTQ
jgi:hypothetical protein